MTNRITEIHGNIFASNCQTLVNTVNCVGIMGAGIALEFKFRHPEMFEKYAAYCKQGLIAVGKLWLYKPSETSRDKRWVLNFPTKLHWKDPSRREYLEAGLAKFIESYRKRGIESIAFPILGAMNGGIDEEESLKIMREYLRECAVPVEIYRYDPRATDDLYNEFRRRILASSNGVDLSKSLGLRRDLVEKIQETLEREPNINSISQLASVKGIGLKSLEKSFRYIMDSPFQYEPATGNAGNPEPPAASELSRTPSLL